jgi:L-fuconolactonase
MINLPIIDAHVHFWDKEILSYPWLNDVPLLDRSFTIGDYYKACDGLEIVKMVFMQCECHPSEYLQEVEWMSRLAEKEPRLQGIIAWAPLEKGEDVVHELAVLKTNPLVKGIRRIIQFEPDLEFCLHPDFITGVRMLKEFDFTFDICISQIHNNSVIRLIDKCPGVQMMLDHIGKPDIRNHLLDPWREEIREMAQYENVYCKLSSLATEADRENWSVDDLRPFAEHIIDCFGIDRLVFGSDWPVSSQAAALPVCVSTILEIMKNFSHKDKQKVFYHNAQVFYRL